MAFLIGLAAFFLGTILASALAALSERIHTGASWTRGRSSCNSCGEPLRARDLVPVLSWVSRAGRARCCGARVTASYALGELALGALFALAAWRFGIGLPLIVFLASLSALFFVVLYDLRHTVVPIGASNALAAFGLLWVALTARGAGELGLALLVAGLIGLSFYAAYILSRGRAMGLGDAPIAFSLALLAGPYLALAGLVFSFWIGAVVGIAILVRRPRGHRIGIEVPFVPFLAAGYLLAIFTQWNPFILVPY